MKITVVALGKIGLPLPSTEVAIRDEAGRELPPGELGEIHVRGPQVMRGYWNMPEETARVLGPDGWLRTGDMGLMDAQGSIQFIDRRKDVIVVSGFKVYPAEIEDVVMLLPGVKEAGAVGMPDARSGEAVRLYLVKKDPALTAEAVLAHCRANLTAYKVPKAVEFHLIIGDPEDLDAEGNMRTREYSRLVWIPMGKERPPEATGELDGSGMTMGGSGLDLSGGGMR